jgi:probable aminopeptidase NPEPL1
MERACEDAGRRSGDLCHALPYAPEFFTKEFSSKVADMRNSVKDRSNAQASCAGQFIANHLDPGWGKKSSAGGGGGGGDDDDDDGVGVGVGVGKTRRWLHVDMAGPSTEKGTGRGTGYGVSLLVELLTGSFYR